MSDELKPCPFCGCDRPFVQTSQLGECTEEARVVCPSCHVATTRELQSWRVSYAGDDLTRTLAIGRAISLWNRRAERTCREEWAPGSVGGTSVPVCSNCGRGWEAAEAYCPKCGARVVKEE